MSQNQGRDTPFIAGEHAPHPIAVIESGHPIVNTDENLRLGLLPNKAARVVLDHTTQPPTLVLDGAWCQIIPGKMKPGGTFQVDTTTGNASLHQVSGRYAGPNSELTITAA
ncbi:hypothetical protein KDA14_01275 [Candidatus Saccharibacteria bacterium]|nr:hypothetical protein [Candidatus Saccharibacteria bacterium]